MLHCTPGPPKIYVCAKYHRVLFKIEDARSGTKIQEHILDPPTTAARQRLQTYILYQTHIGPTFHVGPEYHIFAPFAQSIIQIPIDHCKNITIMLRCMKGKKLDQIEGELIKW